ncbi:MAG: HAD family hydrolase [Candidatus Levybacteria bacterium]|nr:HAD family hydrolase [Candidatus Levybacteria bacterium]MBP9814849.1 HAD family hydrolase [Candidatus Levybacteria bacterium]
MKKKYKLIISDYDGTLAGKDHKISQATSSAIKKWIASGKNFTIATGRQFLMIKHEARELGLTTPQITRGGAEIIDPLTEKVIYSELIDQSTVEDFTSFMKENGYGFIVEQSGTLYSTYHTSYGYPEVQELSFDDFVMSPAPKILVSLRGKDINESEKFLEDVVWKKYPQLHVAKSYNPIEKVWDVTSLSATKHLAVLELLKLLDIPREEAVGVGDGYNDFPLLEACGLKVAMGNAVEELKAIADMVVPTQKEEGVAFLIEKLLREES